MDIQPVILCGGSGTRLWPLSRENYPKQFLSVIGDNSLFQETILRLDELEQYLKGILGDGRILKPLVVANEEHRFLVAEQLRLIDKSADKILLEPVGRNTAPALTMAAYLAIKKKCDPLLLVMPSDHLISDVTKFSDAIANGLISAQSDHIVTFGIVPDRPDTGYGYIKKSSSAFQSGFLVEDFVEKPSYDVAKQYVSSTLYLWNSGIFLVRASTWMSLINEYQNEIALPCKYAIDKGLDDSCFYHIDKTEFEKCPENSIDYAVMEKLTPNEDDECDLKNYGVGEHAFRSVVVPFEAGWSDLGTWSSIWDNSKRDENGNTIRGEVYSYDTENSLLISEDRAIAALGITDMIVIETSDALLVAKKNKSQDVKKIVNVIKKNGKNQHKTHRKVARPWGTYDLIDFGERFKVKRITVKPGASLSLQKHRHRAEHWVVVKGVAKVSCGKNELMLFENQSTYIPVGELHRLENPGELPLEIIEVQSGDYLEEDDIERFDDLYNRL